MKGCSSLSWAVFAALRFELRHSRWCSLRPLTSHPKPVHKGAVTSSCFTRPSVCGHHKALIRFIATVPPVFTCKPLKRSWNDGALTDHTLCSPITLSWCFSDLLLPEVFECDIKWIYLGWCRWQHCGFPSDPFVWWMCTTRLKLSKLSRLFNRNNPEDHFFSIFIYSSFHDWVCVHGSDFSLHSSSCFCCVFPLRFVSSHDQILRVQLAEEPARVHAGGRLLRQVWWGRKLYT